jgi:anthranilate phosphoribosyltransferase
VKENLEALCARLDLGPERVADVFRSVIAGDLSPAELAGFLIALRLKGETPDEVAGAAGALLDAAAFFDRPSGIFADTAGTGGDGSGSINLSTAAGLVAAACGLPVVKHGNRSVSSHCGSADVLEACGARLDADAATLRRALDETGFTFLFAPAFQPGLRHAIQTRRALGVRTIMNRLGPLVNPARPPVQLTGVYDEALVQPTAEALRALGVTSALVVHGSGTDEIALHGPTTCAHLSHGAITSFTLTPEDAGLERHALSTLKGAGPEDNARRLLALLGGDAPTAQLDAVALNAGALLFTAERAASIADGTTAARQALLHGRPRRVLQRFIEVSHG